MPCSGLQPEVGSPVGRLGVKFVAQWRRGLRGTVWLQLSYLMGCFDALPLFFSFFNLKENSNEEKGENNNKNRARCLKHLCEHMQLCWVKSNICSIEKFSQEIKLLHIVLECLHSYGPLANFILHLYTFWSYIVVIESSTTWMFSINALWYYLTCLYRRI